MLICISQVLTRDEVAKVYTGISAGQFVDGRLSAGEMARDVKRNQEFQRADNKPTEMDHIVAGALLKNQEFQDFALPKQIAPPIFSRYEPGMEYGAHIDTPIMGRQSPLRADLSLTVFLNEPDTYDGGELVIDTGFGEQKVKLPAGDAVVYPSGSLHSVAPVTRGARYVALSWVQSVVRDGGIREILHDISIATKRLGDDGEPMTPERRLELRNVLFKAYSNLMRREADI